MYWVISVSFDSSPVSFPDKKSFELHSRSVANFGGFVGAVFRENAEISDSKI